MAPHDDPHYSRKPVPDEFIEHVGPTGLTKQDEFLSRERKYSRDGGDIRKFSNPKIAGGKLDPHYSRKPIPDSMIQGIGETGLTAEEEYLNREKKYFQNGVDVRRFSNSTKGGMEPLNDPYYGRKQVASAQIHGIAETGASKAEEYEVRERKQSVFQDSADPFKQLTGSGHRPSISAPISGAAADARRRSSAVAPDTQAAMASHNAGTYGHGQHSGYTGDDKLAPIQSRTDAPVTTTTTTTTTNTTAIPTHSGNNTTGTYHDATTFNDPDSVDPYDRK